LHAFRGGRRLHDRRVERGCWWAAGGGAGWQRPGPVVLARRGLVDGAVGVASALRRVSGDAGGRCGVRDGACFAAAAVVRRLSWIAWTGCLPLSRTRWVAFG